MRIAISGTHRNGKTALAEAIGRARPDFRVVPEPYEGLLEEGEDFLDHYAPGGSLRRSMDDRLRDLVVSDPLGLLGEEKPEILELWGSTPERRGVFLQHLARTHRTE